MDMTLSTDSLMGQLAAMGSRVCAPPSRDETRSIIERAMSHEIDGQLRLGSEQVNDLISEHHRGCKDQGRSITRMDCRRRVSRVLEALNQLPQCISVLPIEPQPIPRPTAMPTRGELLADIAEAEQRLPHLSTWCRQSPHQDAWLVALATRLAASTGMGEGVIVSTLAMLRHSMVGEDRWLYLPSQPIEGGSIGRYLLQLPEPAWEALDNLRRLAPLQHEDALVLFAERDQERSLQQRIKKIKQRLQAAAKLFLKADQAERLEEPRLLGWHALARASRHLPVLHGNMPLWSTLLLRYPLPTSTHHSLLIRPGHYPDTLLASGQTPYTNNRRTCIEPEALTIAPGVWNQDLQHLPIDWPRRLKNITNRFINTIRNEVAQPYTKAANRRALEAIVARYHDELTQLTCSTTSYVHLLLDWAYDLLCRQPKGNLVTVQTYLSKLTNMYMLEDPAVLELQDWDDDTAEHLQNLLADADTIRASTLSQTVNLMRRFMAFCPEMGLLDGIQLPRVDIDVPLSTLRTDIIAPRQADALWKRLTHAGVDGSLAQMYGLAIALGCYGGMRISEIASLTLQDVQIEPCVTFSDLAPDARTRAMSGASDRLACWVHVHGGKSGSARRRIALHVLSPDSVVPQMQRWIRERQRQCQGMPLANIALFGPRGNPHAFQKQALSRATVELLRQEMSSRIDFHSLRHAAASWLLLRLYAAQSEDFRRTLRFQYDEIFSQERVQEALVHFCAEEGSGTLQRGHLFEVVAKWMGHRHSGTTLQHYVHTLSVIHAHSLESTAPAKAKKAKR